MVNHPSLHPRTVGSDSPSPAPLFTGPPQQRDLAPRPRRGPVTRCACQPCRRKKTKCDGVRPVCSTCAIEGNKARCGYSVREDAASLVDDLRRTRVEAELEKDALRELADYLCLGPEESAWEVFQQLRLRAACSSPGADAFTILQDVVGDVRRRIPDFGTQEMHAIEAEALAGSVIRVPARPWTSVAGDGIVSSLLSAFFKWDEPFSYAYVVRDLFVSDMRHSKPSQAKYCSPLLVNALCAVRSYNSDSVKRAQRASGVDLGEKFFAEAKMHLDAELLKPSLTTAQGLFTIYLYTFGNTTNRAADLYRSAAYEMLRRMKPRYLIAKLDPSVPEEAKQRRALIRAAWGFYVFEWQVWSSRLFILGSPLTQLSHPPSFLSNTYQTPPVISPPTIPKPHDCSDPSAGNIDINGHPYGLLSPGPPMVPGILEVLCDAALLYHKVMVHNSKVRLVRTGGAADMDARMEFFSGLAALEDSFPPRMRCCTNPTPQTLYLKLYFSVIAYNLLRPLPATTRVPYSLHPSGFTTASSLLVQICAADVHLVESYARTWGMAEYSPMLFTGILNVTTSLIPMLPDSSSSSANKNNKATSAPDSDSGREGISASDLFTRACALVPVFDRDYPFVWPVMQGVLALACKMRKAIPPGARRYFEGTWTGGMEHQRQQQTRRRWNNPSDLPINFTFALPVPDRLLPGEGEDEDGGWEGDGQQGARKVGCDLVALLEDWAGLDD
ncbi:hypothetical protein OQA88_13445 [Cercophora sp. LCS_1]